MPKARLRFIVDGIVQGVFFRASTQRKAADLGLFGWVRNLSSGEVECIAEGEKENLELFLEWAKHGPSGAVVEKIDFSWEKPTGKFRRFEITG